MDHKRSGLPSGDQSIWQNGCLCPDLLSHSYFPSFQRFRIYVHLRSNTRVKQEEVSTCRQPPKLFDLPGYQVCPSTYRVKKMTIVPPGQVLQSPPPFQPVVLALCIPRLPIFDDCLQSSPYICTSQFSVDWRILTYKRVHIIAVKSLLFFRSLLQLANDELPSSFSLLFLGAIVQLSQNWSLKKNIFNKIWLLICTWFSWKENKYKWTFKKYTPHS